MIFKPGDIVKHKVIVSYYYVIQDVKGEEILIKSVYTGNEIWCEAYMFLPIKEDEREKALLQLVEKAMNL